MGDNKQSRTFDAIVIGSGMSGGWAAKEFCEKGLKTLVVERGREVVHLKDYPTTNMMPWEFKHRGEVPYDIQKENPVISKCYAFREDAMHFFVKDTEHPYVQDKPFDWIRGYQVGGKSIMWARQTQRWSDFDFEGPARDGFAVDWPIRYNDLAPWYSYVEKFAGISGNKDGLPNLPDGEFLPPLELSCVENYFKESVAKNYKDRNVIYARCAHLTEPQPIHAEQGRGQCQNRNLCQRGCPFGGYYNTNATTIPWAAKTGNMTLRPFSVVHSIIYDDEKNKAVGVHVIDSNTKESIEYYAPVIFLNAGAINTNLILLNSVSKRFPNGLGNENGLLGKYVAFHNYRARISAKYDGFQDSKTDGGRRPTSAYIPRFRNLHKQETNFLRGYACTFSAGRRSRTDTNGFGENLKNNLMASPGLADWGIGSQMMGETIPKESNYVSLDPNKKDNWGVPLLKISVGYDDNEDKMIKDFFEQMTEMYSKAGFTQIETSDSKQAPGLDIHEMGGVRMGKEPKTSLLNKWHQFHNCKNVFVSDGACMTSTSTQNPSLTYMAMTARAADYAISQLKKGEL
ncbi:MAG TPA: GMC family oxidoreductase [Chitinophagaceae bacterium]|nr:GMC family oxidoreductase [Chitinophagaceae bacterium]